MELPNAWKKIHRYTYKFHQKGDSERINEVCQKKASFAGFWFENKFFEPHKIDSHITADCLERGVDKTSQVKFKGFNVAKIDLSHGTLQEGTLYTAHPIVDCVGCLKDESLQRWLMFIQISLQSYEQLSQLFRCNSGNPGNKSWSLYTHYRHLPLRRFCYCTFRPPNQNYSH